MSNKHSRAAEAARHRRNQWVIWGGVAAVAVVAVLIAAVASSGGSDSASSKPASACDFSRDSKTPNDKPEQNVVTVSGTCLSQFASRATDTAVGSSMPTLTGTTLGGTSIEIAPTGKPQVLVFVAHWCPHCQAEVPRIVTLANDGVFDGVDVTAIATGTNSGYPNYPPSEWLKKEQWPFQVMADSGAFTAARAFGLSSYPYIVFVDADGKVVGRTSGEIAPADLTKMVEALKAGQRIPGVAQGASSSSK